MILVVDSHRSNSKIVKLLKDTNQNVTVAGTGAEARNIEGLKLVIVKENQLDCSGMELAAELKNSRNVPAVLLLEQYTYESWQEATKMKIDLVLAEEKSGVVLSESALGKLVQLLDGHTKLKPSIPKATKPVRKTTITPYSKTNKSRTVSESASEKESDAISENLTYMFGLESVGDNPENVTDTTQLGEEVEKNIYGDLPQEQEEVNDDSLDFHNSQDIWREDWEPPEKENEVHIQSWERKGKRDKRVVVIFSPKGGVGKTTTTVSIAYLLHQAGEKVVVVEAEKSVGNMATLLDITPVSYLEDWPHLKNPIEKRITVHESGLHVFPSFPREIETGERAMKEITLTSLMDIITELRKGYDYVLIDAGTEPDSRLRTLLKMSTDFFVITNPDRIACEAVKNVIAKSERIRRHVNTLLIYNLYNKKVGITLKELADETGIQRVLPVPKDEMVQQAANRGKLIASNPKSKYTMAVSEIVKEYLLSSVASNQPNIITKKSLPLWKRLFKNRVGVS